MIMSLLMRAQRSGQRGWADNGQPGVFGAEMVVMAFDQNKTDLAGPDREARARDVDQAQRLLAAALELLDKHDLSQAAANVDLAMHQIDRDPRN
jgi:hypothetical protein